ncbi:hypothetical protein N9E91_02275 [Alphaproteobacteria bacterium]|jgi:hypothetical protein|nr:hypothetical protein [Alphaproteobacteria bacterium]
MFITKRTTFARRTRGSADIASTPQITQKKCLPVPFISLVWCGYFYGDLGVLIG